MNYLIRYQTAHKDLIPDGIIGKRTCAAFLRDYPEIPGEIAFAHFIAQCKVESNGFSAGRENLNYSAEGLIKTFRKYFKDHEINLFARHPIQIANRVYANRIGNGDARSNDGWFFRGTGPLQLTGRNNITAYFKYAGLPLDSSPDIILEDKHYFRSAVWFFSKNNLWDSCENADSVCALQVSKGVNLGNVASLGNPNGWIDRRDATKEICRNLGIKYG